jgi:hypothetical protein
VGRDNDDLIRRLASDACFACEGHGVYIHLWKIIQATSLSDSRFSMRQLQLRGCFSSWLEVVAAFTGGYISDLLK